tara:strand:- start:176777 stop:177724 length:948 start_codon:yes stop_codon:yes gene_type:complete
MKVNILGCGGLGINLGGRFSKLFNIDNNPNIDICYIDFGRSNLTPDHPEDKTIVLPCTNEGNNGSGRKRDENYRSVVDNLERIINTFEPTDITIVVSSTSGGSGAVIAHVLINRLMQLGKIVIPYFVSSWNDETSAQNSLKALDGLFNLPEANGLPLPFYYASNGDNAFSKAVDDDILTSLATLCDVVTLEPHGLDNADLRNFFRWNATNELPNELAILETYRDVSKYNETECLASLRFSKSGDCLDDMGQYKVIQQLGDDVDQDSLDITISSEFLADVFKDGEARLEKHRTARARRKPSISRNANTTGDTNIVL